MVVAKNELMALSLKNEINANHRECLKTANDAIDYALKAGELLQQVKGLVPHGVFQNWVKQHCEFNYDVASGYMRLHGRLLAYSKVERAQLLTDATSVTNLKKLLKPAENGKSRRKNHPPSGSEVPRIGGPPPPASGGNGKPAKPDYGKCPNCLGTRWSEDEEGVSCAKCHHPHGEPAGGVDDKQLSIQRSKTVKTVEALLRAFDDLQEMVAKPEHDEAIEGCKRLLKLAKAWK
jgi:hypothetical protein